MKELHVTSEPQVAEPGFALSLLNSPRFFFFTMLAKMKINSCLINRKQENVQQVNQSTDLIVQYFIYKLKMDFFVELLLDPALK